MTISSPSLLIEVLMFRASEEDTADNIDGKNPGAQKKQIQTEPLSHRES
jgi:hypothetical protein